MSSSNLYEFFGLPKKVIQSFCSIFSCYPEIDQVILYRSRAKGTFREGSAIDLTIKSDTLSLQQLNRIEDNIDDLLLPYSLDISLFSFIDNPDLVNHINRAGKVLYQKL
ncbi:MAG: nucleotidyltransferase domain-containing protein [Bacteroidetes bacterium]|nr:nucleotidyltransferase domain-containing protein [Bacteroidota bacterium]